MIPMELIGMDKYFYNYGFGGLLVGYLIYFQQTTLKKLINQLEQNNNILMELRDFMQFLKRFYLTGDRNSN